MRLMKKALFVVPLLSMILTGCGGKIASGYDPFNKDNIDTEPGNFDFDGNFVAQKLALMVKTQMLLGVVKMSAKPCNSLTKVTMSPSNY